MSIITKDYFSGPISLTADQITNITSDWLDNYEEKILKSLMGHSLYKAYITDLNGTTEPTEQRFQNLVDGAEFSFDFYGSTINEDWGGLRDKTLKKSLIANYVYYHYKNQTETVNTTVGQKSNVAENSTTADVFPKLMSAWNSMVDDYGEIPEDYIEPEYFLDLSSYAHLNAEPSAYNFLLANKDVYPEWIFKPLRKKNILWI